MGGWHRAGVAGLIASCVLLVGSRFDLNPNLSDATLTQLRCEPPAVDVPIAVAVTRGFREFVYAGTLEGRDIAFEFGPAATEPVAELLRSCAPELRFEPVPEQRISVGEAAARFGAGRDYVGVIRFTRISMTATNTRIFIEVGLELELLSRDGSQHFALDGDGLGQARWYSNRSLRDAGREALAGALVSLRMRMEVWGPLLEPSSADPSSPTR